MILYKIKTIFLYFIPIVKITFLSFLFLKPFINELILGIIFAVVCGIMIYISLAELIPSSRSYGHIKLSLLSIFLGIAIMPISHILL